MTKIVFIFLLTFFHLTLISQTYNNPGGTINTCTGTFYDSNGGGQYSPNDDITTTFCSDDGSQITIAFSYFDLDFASQGHLRVYDGPNTGSTLLADLTGNNGGILPSFTATGTCLTFHFQANWFNGNGWVANISCPVVVPTCTEGDCASSIELGFENVSHTVNDVCLDGWELLKGLNNVVGPYTIESSASSWTNCRTSTLVGDIYHSNNCSSNIKIYNGGGFHHDIIDGSSIITSDIHQNVPAVPNLSGSNQNVMRLGESASKGAFNQAEGIITTYTITEPFLAYHYLLKFESTTHDDNNRGFCTFQIRDNLGNVLPCGSFQVYENGASNPGENWLQDGSYTSGLFSTGIWYMDDWNTRIVDVSDYIGQEVTIEVWVADCTHGGHAAWGYFDFESLSSGVTPDCSLVSGLPVEINKIKVKCENDKAFLKWETISERNNSHFTIWKSENGVDFKAISNVLGKGTSNSVNEYSYQIDNNLFNTTYYRISQIDFDGKEKFYETITFYGCDNLTTNLINNGNSIKVIGEDINRINIVDGSGRVIEEIYSIDSNQSISIENLEIGVYFITVYQKNTDFQVFKIFKN